MRLIDAEALKRQFFEHCRSETECLNHFWYDENIINLIDNAPTVEERPQGEWIVTAEDNDGVHRICCPFCSYEQGSNNALTIRVTFTKLPNFCENCGADMRKGEEK